MTNFKSYDYKKITVSEENASYFKDSYKAFGYVADENMKISRCLGNITFYLKRDKNIINRIELTRLERHFESCTAEIEQLKGAPKNSAKIYTATCTSFACAFMAGSVFAITASPPLIALCIAFAAPAFALVLAACLGRKHVKGRRQAQTRPLIEAKLEEAENICKKASKLTQD